MYCSVVSDGESIGTFDLIIKRDNAKACQRKDFFHGVPQLEILKVINLPVNLRLIYRKDFVCKIQAILTCKFLM